jgi:hypothetical protein
MFLISNILGSLFWGVIVALFITILVFIICLLINNQTLRSPIALIVLGGIFVYNAAFATLIAGTFYARDYVESLCVFMENLTNTGKTMIGTVADFNELKDQIAEEYTSAKPILDLIDANEAVNQFKAGKLVAEYISEKINNIIDDYVHKCLLWMGVGSLIGAIMAAAVVKKGGHNSYSLDISSYGFDNDTSSADYY